MRKCEIVEMFEQLSVGVRCLYQHNNSIQRL